MSIRIERPENPTHEENLIYYGECLSCPKISEENGDELPGNFEVASFGDNLTRVRAVELAKRHERLSGKHEIILRAMDIRALQNQIY
jgi:hypothetical protein